METMILAPLFFQEMSNGAIFEQKNISFTGTKEDPTVSEEYKINNGTNFIKY